MEINNIENLIKFKDGKKVLLDGPLSRIFTQILHDEYAKEIEKESGMVLESQVMQVEAVAKNYLEMINAQGKDNDDVGMLYVVDSKETIAKDLTNISTAVAVMNNNQIRNSAIIIDKPDSDEEEKHQKLINGAVVDFGTFANIPVFNSLEAYLNRNKAV